MPAHPISISSVNSIFNLLTPCEFQQNRRKLFDPNRNAIFPAFLPGIGFQFIFTPSFRTFFFRIIQPIRGLRAKLSLFCSKPTKPAPKLQGRLNNLIAVFFLKFQIDFTISSGRQSVPTNRSRSFPFSLFIVREELDDPSVYYLEPPYFFRMIFKHIAPELLVYFAFRRFDELFQKGLQFGNPPFQPVFFQPSGLTQYFLPIFRRSFERYFGNSANDTQHDKLEEIRFRGPPSRSLRKPPFPKVSSSKKSQVSNPTNLSPPYFPICSVNSEKFPPMRNRDHPVSCLSSQSTIVSR